MRLLAVDCSTPSLSVALLQDSNILYQNNQAHRPPAPNPLLSMVHQALEHTGPDLSQVDGFAVTLGPGSFTGLRVGLSLVKGLVMATGKPCVGVSTLEAWAFCAVAKDRPVCAVLDARKGEVYYAHFRDTKGTLEPLGAEGLAPPGRLAETLEEPTSFIGTGVDTYGDFLRNTLGARFRRAAFKPGMTPAGAAALIAGERFDRQAHVDLDRLSLRYLRTPEAEKHLQGNTVLSTGGM